MSDLSEFLKPVPRGPRCGVEKALEKLDGDDRDLIVRAIAHPDAEPRRIADWLADRLDGSTPNKETVARHRRGDCRCPRVTDE